MKKASWEYEIVNDLYLEGSVFVRKKYVENIDTLVDIKAISESIKGNIGFVAIQAEALLKLQGTSIRDELTKISIKIIIVHIIQLTKAQREFIQISEKETFLGQKTSDTFSFIIR